MYLRTIPGTDKWPSSSEHLRLSLLTAVRMLVASSCKRQMMLALSPVKLVRKAWQWPSVSSATQKCRYCGACLNYPCSLWPKSHRQGFFTAVCCSGKSSSDMCVCVWKRVVLRMIYCKLYIVHCCCCCGCSCCYCWSACCFSMFPIVLDFAIINVSIRRSLQTRT